MDLFVKAKSIRLVTYNDRYLVAEGDCLTISHSYDGSAKNAVWIVEIDHNKEVIRLKSCFGTYLTASSMPFLPGAPTKKVVQSWPAAACDQCDDSATEWEPLRDGMQVRLRSIYGHFLRPHSGLPPWRNSITHDIPYRNKAREKVLWDVEVVEKCSIHCTSQSSINRSRSFSDSFDLKKQRLLQDDQIINAGDHRLSHAKCFWYPKLACMPF